MLPAVVIEEPERHVFGLDLLENPEQVQVGHVHPGRKVVFQGGVCCAKKKGSFGWNRRAGYKKLQAACHLADSHHCCCLMNIIVLIADGQNRIISSAKT